MISRVRIKGYKSLQDTVVELPGQLTVMMGPNASGKSNLLDALGLVSRMGLSSTLEEAFKDHRGRIVEAFTFGPGGLQAAIASNSLSFSIEVDVELSESAIRETEEEISRRRAGFEAAKPERAPRVAERLLRYRVEIEYRPQEQVLRVIDEELAAVRKDLKPKKSRPPFLSREKEGNKQVLRLRLEGQAARPLEFEVGLPYTVLSRPHYAPHYPHIDAFKRELAGWHFYYLEPRVMRADNDLKVVSVPGHYGEDLAAFFDTLRARRPKQFEATQKALRHVLPVIEGVDVERADDGLLRIGVTEDGVDFPARVMSEGTLRLLGLLAILQPDTPATLVGFEEPENGLHPRRVGTIARLLENVGEKGKFQIIANTHSPLLAQMVPPDSLVVCRKGPGGTAFKRLEDQPLWRELETEEALSAQEEEE
ncbi:MAG: AAA family ATPase, partial [Planctomycetota bacterium]